MVIIAGLNVPKSFNWWKGCAPKKKHLEVREIRRRKLRRQEERPFAILRTMKEKTHV